MAAQRAVSFLQRRFLSQSARGKGFLERPRPKQNHEYAILYKDPAIEAWATAREQTYKHTHWTPQFAWWSFVIVLGIPVPMYYALCYFQEKKEKEEGREFIAPWWRPMPEDNSTDPLPPRKPGIDVEKYKYLYTDVL